MNDVFSVETPAGFHIKSKKKKKDNLTGHVSSGGNFVGIMHGDSATMLKTLPNNVFNVAVTSPPYYWVRDYGFDGQLGHEESVEAYVEALMRVFDEVKRTLHPEGIFFLNIGDTYYSGNGQPHGSDPKCSSRNFLRLMCIAEQQNVPNYLQTNQMLVGNSCCVICKIKVPL